MICRKIILLALCTFSGVLLYGQAREIETENTREQKKLKIAALPYINYSRTIDFSYGLMGTAFYKINREDSISPSSSTMLVGIYSTSKSYVGMLVQQFFLAEDTWRTKLSMGTGTGNLQFYEEFYTGGQFVDYSNNMRFLIGRVSRRMVNNLFIGASGGISNSRTEFEIEPQQVIDIPLNFLGGFIQSDSRNNVNYPSAGHKIEADYKNFGEWLGNDQSFHRLDLTYDHYTNFGNEDRVFLARFHSRISFGDVPFVGQHTVGGENIRGYSEGRYRDNELYSVQGEYRHKFKSRFGFVAFGGFAMVTPEISELFDQLVLPGVGAGIRYRILEKEKINLGLDVAVGRNDWSLSFLISDAFSR